jgi:hypothetical protein
MKVRRVRDKWATISIQILPSSQMFRSFWLLACQKVLRSLEFVKLGNRCLWCPWSPVMPVMVWCGLLLWRKMTNITWRWNEIIWLEGVSRVLFGWVGLLLGFMNETKICKFRSMRHMSDNMQVCFKGCSNMIQADKVRLKDETDSCVIGYLTVLCHKHFGCLEWYVCCWVSLICMTGEIFGVFLYTVYFG